MYKFCTFELITSGIAPALANPRCSILYVRDEAVVRCGVCGVLVVVSYPPSSPPTAQPATARIGTHLFFIASTMAESGTGIQELMAAETRASQIVAEARIGEWRYHELPGKREICDPWPRGIVDRGPERDVSFAWRCPYCPVRLTLWL